MTIGEARVLLDDLNDYIDAGTPISRESLSLFDDVAEATGGVWTVERVAADVVVDLDNMNELDRRSITWF